jgi:hypothetical protein
MMNEYLGKWIIPVILGILVLVVKKRFLKIVLVTMITLCGTFFAGQQSYSILRSDAPIRRKNTNIDYNEGYRTAALMAGNYKDVFIAHFLVLGILAIVILHKKDVKNPSNGALLESEEK